MISLFRRSLILLFAGAIGLVAKADAPKVQFTDSSAAGLAATKRVAITSVIVSHDLVETMEIADYIYVIANGKIIGQGRPDELKNSDSALVRQFLTGSPDGPIAFHYPAPDYRTDLLGGQPW